MKTVDKLPVNAVLVEPGHVAFQIPEGMADGEWRMCIAWRFNRLDDGTFRFEIAAEDDLDAITSPGAP